MMDKLWKHHFKYYDLFQNNSDRYRGTIKLHLLDLIEFKNILDTGAGSGNLTLELLKKGCKVTAIDTDKFSLDLLRKKCFEFNEDLKVLTMNVQKLDFRDCKFGGVSSMFVIPFVKDNQKYFSEVHRVLKKGGKFTISAWAPLKDSLCGLMKLLETEFKEKGLLPKYKKEWDHIFESSKIHIKTVVRGPNIEKLKRMLEEAGFKKIKVYSENPYKKYAYFLTCEK